MLQSDWLVWGHPALQPLLGGFELWGFVRVALGPFLQGNKPEGRLTAKYSYGRCRRNGADILKTQQTPPVPVPGRETHVGEFQVGCKQNANWGRVSYSIL